MEPNVAKTIFCDELLDRFILDRGQSHRIARGVGKASSGERHGLGRADSRDNGMGFTNTVRRYDVGRASPIPGDGHCWDIDMGTNVVLGRRDSFIQAACPDGWERDRGDRLGQKIDGNDEMGYKTWGNKSSCVGRSRKCECGMGRTCADSPFFSGWDIHLGDTLVSRRHGDYVQAQSFEFGDSWMGTKRDEYSGLGGSAKRCGGRLVKTESGVVAVDKKGGIKK